MPYENYVKWKTELITEEPKLSIVIPAYNERERIVATIGAIASHVSDLGFPWELLIADDGSKDDTVQLVEGLQLVNLKVLKTPKNGGKGSAVQRGMLAARGKYILFDDADNSTPIEEVSKLLNKLEKEGFDVAVGSRAAEGAEEGKKSLFRKILSSGLRWIVKNIFQIGVRDTQCGFKMYTRDAAQRLHTKQTIMGFSFDLEILYLASKYGYRIAEVPVSWIDAPGSKVDTRKEVQRFLRDLMKIKMNDLKGVYRKSENWNTAGGKGMRIALVTAHPPSKGSLNEYAFHLVRHLKTKVENVHEVILLLDELPEGQSYSIEQPFVSVRCLPCWKFNGMDNALRIRRAVREVQPDIVLFNIQFASFGDRKIPATLGLLTPWLLKRDGRKVVVLLHNIMETVNLKSAGFGSNPIVESVIRAFGNMITRFILAADWVAVTIPKYVEILESKYGAKNVWLAPHGSFEEPTDTEPSPMPGGCPTVMTFGKFGTYKTVDRLIEAHEILQKNHPDLRLVIAGTDSPNAAGYLKSMQDKYAHVKNIEYTGYVAEQDVARIFGEAWVVAFPYTSTTGSSGVLHQAGGYGKAVVLPNLGDLAELVLEEGYDGEFFEPTDVKSLADAITRVIDNPERQQEIGLRNYTAANGLPISEVVDWYLIHFKELLKKK